MSGESELRRAITDVPLPLPRVADGRLVLAVDVWPWPRPDTNTSPDRCFCQAYGRGKDEHRTIPGWPYSFVAALETGPKSWTAIPDAIRLPPGAGVVAITAAQLREVVERLPAARHRTAGDPEILIVADAGYDAPRMGGPRGRVVGRGLGLVLRWSDRARRCATA
nr:transposase [Catenulispora pinisilvae]